MKTLPKYLCAAVALTVTCGLIQAQDAQKLRYNLKKGDKLVYRQKQSMKQTQTVKDKKVETDISSTNIGVWTVEKVDQKGNLHLQTENKRMNVNVKIGPLGEYKFDSKSEEHDRSSQLGAALTPLYERLSGASIRFVVSPRGEVKSIKGYKELLGDVLKNNPLAAQFAAGANNDNAAKLNFAEFFPLMNKDAVREGDMWEKPFELNLAKLGKATGKRIYTFAGAGKVGNRKTLKLTTNIELSFDLKLDMGGAKVTGTLSITDSKGTIHLDPKRGNVVSLSTAYTLSGDLNVSVNGMDIPVGTVQNQQITMELLNKLPK